MSSLYHDTIITGMWYTAVADASNTGASDAGNVAVADAGWQVYDAAEDYYRLGLINCSSMQECFPSLEAAVAVSLPSAASSSYASDHVSWVSVLTWEHIFTSKFVKMLLYTMGFICLLTFYLFFYLF